MPEVAAAAEREIGIPKAVAAVHLSGQYAKCTQWRRNKATKALTQRAMAKIAIPICI